MTLQLPIGSDNFKKIIDAELDFVDKSLFIKEILDDRSAEAIVIIRPRRFGKTLNLSMLHHFLASEAYGQSTEGLFQGLKISELGNEYLRHQGRYPVIFITFKDVKDHNFEHTLRNIQNRMSTVFKEYRYLLSSDKLDDKDKKFFRIVLNREADVSDLQASIENLTTYLFQHHGVKPWVLIDEYDTPILSAYLHGYYEELSSLMGNMFSAALNSNPYLERAVLVGILHITKLDHFSGLNNLKLQSMLRSRYRQYFEFTEEKIWINTKENQLIKNLIVHTRKYFHMQFKDLLAGKLTEHLIDENVAFGDLKCDDSAAWSILLLFGYLKVISSRRKEGELWCVLDIPNQEMRSLYQNIIETMVVE